MTWLITAAAITALAMAVVRLLRGPGDANRIVAVDLLFAASIALVAAAALETNQPRLLDIGIGLAGSGFVGTIAWARMAERGRRRPS